MFLDSNVVTCTGKNIIYNHRLVGSRIWPNQAGLTDIRLLNSTMYDYLHRTVLSKLQPD